MQSITKLSVVVLWLSALLMLTSSCQHNYIVKGTTDASVFHGSSIALKVLTGRYQWTSLDSCEVTHGMFLMKGRMDSVVFATLFLDDIPVIGNPIKLSETPVTYRRSACESGHDNEEILQELLQFDKDRIGKLKDDKII